MRRLVSRAGPAPRKALIQRPKLQSRSPGTQPTPSKTTVAVVLSLRAASPAAAAQCGGDFNTFLAAMGREAQAAGVSAQVVSTAFSGLTPDPAVLNFDR